MLWKMLAYSLHYSAKRRTGRDIEGGNELNSGVPSHAPLVPPGQGCLFFKQED